MADIETKGDGPRQFPGQEVPRAEWQRALEYVQDNPRTVVLAVLFLIVCAAIGGVYTLYSIASDREVMTEYAEVIAEEDPDIRASALKQVADRGSRWSVEALYLAGEASIEAGQFGEAREIFDRLLREHPDSRFAAPAAEGLAFLDENDGDLEAALEGYQRVFSEHGDTFIGRRQPLNIARVYEALEQFPEAVEYYDRQVAVFPESSVAAQAEQALGRLQPAHPELFPEEETAEGEMDSAPVEAVQLPPAPGAPAPANAGDSPAAVESVDPEPEAETPAEEAGGDGVADDPAGEAPGTEVDTTETTIPANDEDEGSS